MIKPFEKDRIDTEDIIIGSDWDNSYQLCSSMMYEFNKDCAYIEWLRDWSEEHLDTCEDFNNKYSQYQI